MSEALGAVLLQIILRSFRKPELFILDSFECFKPLTVFLVE